MVKLVPNGGSRHNAHFRRMSDDTPADLLRRRIAAGPDGRISPGQQGQDALEGILPPCPLWLIARHAPGVGGLHLHVAEDGHRETREHFPIFLPDGTTWLNLTDWQRKNFVPVGWDERPEVVFALRKQDKCVVRLHASGEMEGIPHGKLPEGRQFQRNLASVDVIGDFSENIVTFDLDRKRLMVLMNPSVASRRGFSPMDDFEYRHDRSQLGSGYYIYLSPPITTV